MNSPERIGVYGGTFDPIHRTHVAIARAARDAKELDRVLFVVSAVPPHKDGAVFTDAADRLAMVELAIAGEAGMEACRIEMDRDGPSYTVDTLGALKEKYPAAEFYLIIGSDSLADLHKWHRPEEICAQANLLVVARPDCPYTVGGTLVVSIQVVPMPESLISSTDIRRRARAGERLSEFVVPGVERLIRERGLYDADC